MTRKTNWKRKFEDPISLLSGKKLVTLRDAADYITSLTKKESDLPGWQAATEALMLVSRSVPKKESAPCRNGRQRSRY